MSVYIFTGPTISPAEARAELGAVYLPPAAEGDVYRAALKAPQAIGIIDGYFQSVPTIRHKEILWAMSRGIHVFGSSSIGALRAAELAVFGMEGVGTVFEWYRDGVLEDDDEVAIVHGPAEIGFLAGSDAMVNIRQTLRKAELVGIISKEFGLVLEKIGKDLFYPDRKYSVLLRYASRYKRWRAELARLRQWLPTGQINQKRKDAVAMLRLMRRRLAQGLRPKRVSYSFEHTSMWETASRQSGEIRFDRNTHASPIVLDPVLDELRLEGDQFKQHGLAALERFLTIREADRLGVRITNRRRKEAEQAFRRERHLDDAEDLERWMNDNSLTRDEFDVLMADEARARWIHQHFHFAVISRLAEELRLSGNYPRFVARASAKNELLESRGLKNPCLRSAALTEKQLLKWYFTKLVHQRVPDDIESYARELGFAGPDAFRRALLKEYLYRRFQDQTLQMIEPVT